MTAFASTLRRHPVTITIVILIVLLAVVTGALKGPSERIREIVGLDPAILSERHWWALVTSNFFVENLGQLIVVVIAAVIGIGVSERLMGSWRTAVAFVVTGALGSALGLAFQAIGTLAGEYWSVAVRDVVTLDPLTPIAGTLAWASASATPLWRRRIRVIVLTVSLVFLLYSGQPSDLYRVLAVLLGIVIGGAFEGRRAPITRWRSSHHETRVLLSIVAMILAVGPIIALLSRTRYGLLSPLGLATTGWSPTTDPSVLCSPRIGAATCATEIARMQLHGIGPLLVSLLPLIVMLIAARGLLVGSRLALGVLAALSVGDSALVAWYFGLIPGTGIPFGVPAHASGQRYGELTVSLILSAVVPLAFAVLLFMFRKHFTVRVPGRSLRRFALAVSAGFLAPAAAYLGLGTLIGSQFTPAATFVDLLSDLPERFIPISFLKHQPVDLAPATPLARLLFEGIGLVFWITLAVSTAIFIRGRGAGIVGGRERAQFRALLRREGGGSLAYMGVWEGNRYWFSKDGSCGIAYRVVNGIAVTTGDPVGADADCERGVLAFSAFCDANGWTPVFYSVHARWARLLGELGWRAVPVAEETVLDATSWTIAGSKRQNIRTAVNKAQRDGVRVRWDRWRDLPQRVTGQIEELSEQWLAEKDLPELGFTLGGIDELRDDDVLVGVALDAHDAVLAVTSWLPSWKNGELVGYTLDFMRRRSDGPNGVMEFVIADAAERARVRGIGWLSLSAAPLAVAPDEVGSGALARILGIIGRTLEPVYGFRSLLNFKKKFQPTLVPLYLVVPDPVLLPAIGLAIARCYLPTMTMRQTTLLLRRLT